jgi:hypothetical protein
MDKKLKERRMDKYKDILKEYNILNEGNYNFLNESKIMERLESKKEEVINSYKKNIEATKKYLKDNNINIKIISDTAKKVVRGTISTTKKIVDDIGNSFIVMLERLQKESNLSNMRKSLLLLIALFYMYCISFYMLEKVYKTFSSKKDYRKLTSYMFISACIIAPFLEEFAKKLAVRERYGFIYTAIFAGIEGIGYIVSGVLAGYPLLLVANIRFISFFSHMFDTYKHEKHFNKDPDKKIFTIGFFIVILFHGLWNLMPIISRYQDQKNKENQKNRALVPV